MTWFRSPVVQFAAVVIIIGVAHLTTFRDSEPFFNNDETRHTMTGVFVADAARDLPAFATNPKEYAIRYYCQYPGLGIISWPPLFYLIEGLAMLAFGPHFWVGRLCVAAFAVLALVYTYRFARLQFEFSPFPHSFSLLAVVLTALTPLVLIHSQRVMLEIPTLALLMVALTHFEKYLLRRQGRDAILACLFAALTALTRYDGVTVGLYFLFRLFTSGQYRVLFNRPVIGGIAVALLLTVPYYAFTWKVYSSGLGTAVTAGTNPESTGFFRIENLPYYLLTLPQQAGQFLTVAFVLGLAITFLRYRRATVPTLSLMAAIYAFYTPLAQMEVRYTIYWLPAVAVIACRLVQFALDRSRLVAILITLGLLIGSVGEIPNQKYRYVFGYEDAAQWVLSRRTTTRPVLVDGELTTSLVYHVRKNDPSRTLWVVRGDKLIYAMFSNPSSGYKQFAHTEEEVLERFEQIDPEFVVIEDPPPAFHTVPGAELLRVTLRKHPDRYEAVHTIPIRSNYDRFTDTGAQLIIYHKPRRNPNAADTITIEVIGIGRTLGAERK